MICNLINGVSAQNWTPPNTTNVVVTQDARVGVGVAQPSEALHVAGLVRIDSLANMEGKKYLLYVDESGVIHIGAEYKPNPGLCDVAKFTYWQTNGNHLTPGPVFNSATCEFIGSINPQPLIFKTNNQHRMTISENGNFYINGLVGIGVSQPQHHLSVNGVSYFYAGNTIEPTLTIDLENTSQANGLNVLTYHKDSRAISVKQNQQETFCLFSDGRLFAKEIRVKYQNPWPDYVFDNEDQLLPLKELKQFIKEHKHLPKIPTAKEVEQSGINVAEMNKLLLEKIEELTLYVIQLEEKIQQLQNK